MSSLSLEALESRIFFAITNSFEQPALAAGAFAPLSNLGWTILWGYGSATPQAWFPAATSTDFSAVNPLAAPAQGKQVGSIGGAGGAVERFFGTIAAKTRYTLTVAVGDRLSEAFGNWSIQLLAGSSAGTSLLAQLSRGQTGTNLPANGGWADNTVLWDSTTDSSKVGKSLFVRLVNTGGASPGPVCFDNLRLSNDQGLTLFTSSGLVELSNFNQKVSFTKNAGGKFIFTSYVRNGSTWQSMFDLQMPIIQGTDFDLLPTAYQVVENSAARIAVNFTGIHPTRGYAWNMLVEAKAGSDLVHFSVSTTLTQALPLSGLEPQAAFMMSPAASVKIGQGPGNIYYGYAETQWGNSFPAAYLWSGGKEAAVFFDMSPMTWMSSGNLNRFWDVRANAFTQSGKSSLGLQVVHRTGSSIAAGTTVNFDFYLYSKTRSTPPTKNQALDTMVRTFEPVHRSTSTWPANPNATWTNFAAGTSGVLMQEDTVWADWNLVPVAGSSSFEETTLPADGISPLSHYGWSDVAGYGTALAHAWHPASTTTDFTSVNPLASPASGSYAAFIQEPGGGTEKVLGSILANNAYTITVAIGNRIAESYGDWSIQLWAGDSNGTTFLAQKTRDTAGASHPVAGGWADNSISLNSAAIPSLIGKNLFVRITNYGGTHPGTIFFDNVRTTGQFGPISDAGAYSDGPLFTENKVNVLRVSGDYANRANLINSWDFSTVNNYLAGWIGYDRLNPGAARHDFISVKTDDLPLFYDPNAKMIRWGTRSPLHVGDMEMSWQNFTFSLETLKSYLMLAPEDFNPAIAGKFLMGLQGMQEFAHNVNYVFPQWFNPYTKQPLTQQDVPELGTVYEPWQGGTYAYLMIYGYKITGDQSYLNEAKACVDRLLGGTMSFTVSNARYTINYSDPADFPITEPFGNAWGIAAAQQLYTLTGDAKYQQYSDDFFNSLMRLSYWYESNLSVDPLDQANQNNGMIRNQGGAFLGSPWENTEAVLPLTLRLKNDAQPRPLMLKLLNLHRINDFYFYGQSGQPTDYLPAEDFHTYEGGGSNGGMGRAVYMSSTGFWNYLLFDAFAGASDREVMVANLDPVDSFQAAAGSSQRNFIVYNPTTQTKTFTLTMKSLASGQYDLVFENSLGQTTQSSYSSAALLSGVQISLTSSDYLRIRLRNSQFGAIDGQIQLGQSARDRISYAYQLLQQSATSGGVTPALLSLKATYLSALNDYGSTTYASAISKAQQVIDQLLNPAPAPVPAPARIGPPQRLPASAAVGARVFNATSSVADRILAKKDTAVEGFIGDDLSLR